jgi:hypothetical protein
MQKANRLIKWLLKAWPFLVVAAVGCMHYLFYKTLQIEGDDLNKIAAATLQLVGGLIVLYKINENIGLFKQQNLLSMAVGWLKEFPLIRRSETVELKAGVIGVSSAGPVSVHVKRKCDTVEERLEELERQIDECRQLVHDKEKEINFTIVRVRQELEKEISVNRDRVQDVSSLIDQTAVGGIKVQLLGVLLVIYGAIIGVV